MPFTVGVIVLSAKMAKADGIVAADEVKAFKEAFKVSGAEMKRAAPVFNSAKRDAANFEAHAEQLVAIFNGNRKLLERRARWSLPHREGRPGRASARGSFLAAVAKCFGFTAGRVQHDQGPTSWSPTSAILMRCLAHAFGQRRGAREITTAGFSPITMRNSSSHRACRRSSVIIAIERRAALSEAYQAILKERST